MKALLAIVSCWRDSYLEQLQRDTFLCNSPLEHRFFRGARPPGLPDPPADVVVLDAPDGFLDLPFKVQAVCRWALAQGYDRLFKCDTDTYVRPERLLAAAGDPEDYIGWFSYDPCPGAYGSGGSGYWVSQRSLKVIAASDTFFRDSPRERVTDEPSTRGEDLQVGWALRDAGIHCRKDDRYRLRYPGPRLTNSYVTLHDVLIMNKQHRLMRAHYEWISRPR